MRKWYFDLRRHFHNLKALVAYQKGNCHSESAGKYPLSCYEQFNDIDLRRVQINNTFLFLEAQISISGPLFCSPNVKIKLCYDAHLFWSAVDFLSFTGQPKCHPKTKMGKTRGGFTTTGTFSFPQESSLTSFIHLFIYFTCLKHPPQLMNSTFMIFSKYCADTITHSQKHEIHTRATLSFKWPKTAFYRHTQLKFQQKSAS